MRRTELAVSRRTDQWGASSGLEVPAAGNVAAADGSVGDVREREMPEG